MTSSRLSVWPPLNPAVYGRTRAATLPWPLEDPHCRLFARARHALRRSLTAAGLEPGDRVLTPAYHHGSEVEALVRGGIECVFYDATEKLSPSEDVLEGLIDERVKALYLIHYLGIPQDVARWRRWCDERGLLLIEDAAQAWTAEVSEGPVGSFGDISFFCLYKTYGLVDGAALLARRPPEVDTGPGPIDVAGLLKRHASWLEARSARAAAALDKVRSSNGYDPERDFDLGDPYRAPARATLGLLPFVVEDDVAARRRVNYGVLLSELGEMVEPPFDELPEGASPFAFPIATDDKSSLLARLSERGVAGLDFWSQPHPTLEVGAYPEAARRRARTIGLPVHQELRTEDIERIADAVRPRRDPVPLVTFERVDDIAPFRDEWTRLAERSRNVFSTWEWADVWNRHFLSGRPMVIGRLGRSSEARAIVPLYMWSEKPMRVLRFLGHGPADQLGPVCDPTDTREVGRALRRALAVSPGLCDVLLGDYLGGDQPLTQLMDASVLRRFPSPVLRFEGDWEQYLASRSSNFREQIRRRERKLAQKHDVSFRLATDTASLERDLDLLFALYRARWGPDSGSFPAAQVFHEDFARVAAERGWLRLWFLELDDRPVAAWYGFRFAGVESFYQAGRDPQWADASVGLVLLAHTIREALNDGLSEYRFLRGGEDYKYRFTSLDPGVATAAWARGPLRGSGLRLAAALGGSSTARRFFGPRLARLPGE